MFAASLGKAFWPLPFWRRHPLRCRLILFCQQRVRWKRVRLGLGTVRLLLGLLWRFLAAASIGGCRLGSLDAAIAASAAFLAAASLCGCRLESLDAATCRCGRLADAGLRPAYLAAAASLSAHRPWRSTQQRHSSCSSVSGSHRRIRGAAWKRQRACCGAAASSSTSAWRRLEPSTVEKGPSPARGDPPWGIPRALR